ncbi:MAG: pyridoxamine 5'-phosphate oxidase family protein [Sporichthyaceae bacterium]
MDTKETTRQLHDALDGLRMAMVGTADGQVWKSRPLALAEQDGPTLSFLVSTGADWVEALETNDSPATVTFADPGKNTYVALQGHAQTRDDRATIERLWNAGAAAYFDGKDDPSVRVLEVVVNYGEWWDGPSGRIGELIAIAGAAIGRQAGDKGPVAAPRKA